MIDIYKDLDELRIENYQQGSVPSNMPDSYITVWNDNSTDNLNSDNKTNLIEYQFTLIYYTKEWSTMYSVFENIVSLLKTKNYIIDGMGFDIDSGVDGYMARCIEVTKLERRN